MKAIAHRIQKLIAAAEMQRLAQFLLHPALHAPSIPHTASGGVCSDGLSQQQQVSVAQERGCALVLVPLILQPSQPMVVVGIQNLVRALVGVASQSQRLCVAFSFSQEGEQLAASSFDGASTPAVDPPELSGLVVEDDFSDLVIVSDFPESVSRP